MFNYLMEREQEEWFRTSKRRLTLPDGTETMVEAYRLVWTWFDRSCAYEFGLDQEEILTFALRCQETENVDLGAAIGQVLDHFVRRLEAQGADHTDDCAVLDVAKRHSAKFYARNRKAG